MLSRALRTGLAAPIKRCPSVASRMTMPVRRYSPEAYTLAKLGTGLPKPSRDISHLPPVEDSIVSEGKRQVAIGNPAEGWGVSEHAGVIGRSGIIEQYGVWPTLGLFAVAAVSKEWYIIDEEIVLVGTFLTAYGTAFVTFREDMKGFIQEGIQKIKDEWYNSIDSQLDALDAHEADMSRLMRTDFELAPSRVDFAETRVKFAQAAEKMYHTQWSNFVEKRLSAVEVDENKAYSDLRDSLAHGAAKHAMEQFSTSPKAAQLRSASVKSAIDSLASGKRVGDPVKPLVDSFVKETEAKFVQFQKTQTQNALQEIAKLKAADTVPQFSVPVTLKGQDAYEAVYGPEVAAKVRAAYAEYEAQVEAHRESAGLNRLHAAYKQATGPAREAAWGAFEKAVKAESAKSNAFTLELARKIHVLGGEDMPAELTKVLEEHKLLAQA